MTSSQRIAVVGVGRIGSTFAFQLARQGQHDVTAIARPDSARLGQLRRDGGIVNVEGERAEVRVSDTLDEQVPYDLVLVTLLARQVGAVLPSLQRSAARWVLFMFNCFEPERLRDAVGAGRCSFGMPFVQANLDADGKLRASIGAGGQKTKLSRQDWVDVFVAAGLPAVLEPEMLLWLRCHVPLCVAFESVSVAGMRRGGGGVVGRGAGARAGDARELRVDPAAGVPAVSEGEVVAPSQPGLGGGGAAVGGVAHSLVPRVAGDGERGMSRAGGHDGGSCARSEPAGRRGKDSSHEAMSNLLHACRGIALPQASSVRFPMIPSSNRNAPPHHGHQRILRRRVWRRQA